MNWLNRLLGGARAKGDSAAVAHVTPATTTAPKPPVDWSDAAAWDAYHAATKLPAPISPIELGLQYVPAFREQRFRRVWFPGAGTSAAPRAFAQLGFDVVSTDFSAVAVEAQERFASAPFTVDLSDYGEKVPTKLQVLKHDFRQPLDLPPFDVIVNRRSYQGLSTADQATAARQHYDALRPGGWAMFETMNVQGDRRNILEDAIGAAGFSLPLNRSHRWYRAELAKTGLRFVIILGRARIPGPNPSAAEQERLDILTKEFAERSGLEAEEWASRTSARTDRVAHMVYSTG